jgi:hypothetical protein
VLRETANGIGRGGGAAAAAAEAIAGARAVRAGEQATRRRSAFIERDSI